MCKPKCMTSMEDVSIDAQCDTCPDSRFPIYRSNVDRKVVACRWCDKKRELSSAMCRNCHPKVAIECIKGSVVDNRNRESLLSGSRLSCEACGGSFVIMSRAMGAPRCLDCRAKIISLFKYLKDNGVVS